MKLISKMVIVSAALISVSAFAQSGDMSTDTMRADSHVVTAMSQEEAVARNAEHDNALNKLEATGDVDQYIENNNHFDSQTSVNQLNDCANEALPEGVKVEEGCN